MPGGGAVRGVGNVTGIGAMNIAGKEMSHAYGLFNKYLSVRETHKHM